MAPVLPILIVLLVAGGIAYVAWTMHQRQLARARAIAAAAGLQIDTDTKRPPALDFELFERGSSKKVRHQMWRAGEQDSVFQYEYTTGSGDNARTYTMTCALVTVPFRAPHLTITTENWWTRIKRAVGSRDIEVESPVFNDRYHVRCEDERFAITLLDPDMIAWMLSPASGQGAISFELRGSWLLAYGDELDLEYLPPLLAWAQGARLQLPTVLTEWYGG